MSSRHSNYIPMKRLLLLLALCVSTTAWAQWHIDLGAGISHVNAPYPGTGAGIGCSLGAGYHFQFTPEWGLNPVCQLSWQGEKNYGALYVKMPILVSFRIANVEVEAGPYASYGLTDKKNEDRIYDAPPQGTTLDPWARSAFGYFNRFDMGLTSRICYHFPKFFLGLEGSYGLLDIARKDLSKSFSAHSMGLNLLAGVKF